MDAGVSIRAAVVSDARGIAEVHVQAWTETYNHLLPADALARQSVEQRTLRWAELISAGVSVSVAVMDDVIVGFGSSSAGHIDGPRNLELEALYIVASHYGSGAGQGLLDAAVGVEPAYLWVADDNPRARAFYSRNGFVADGLADMHPLAGTPVRAIRMVR